MTTFDREWFRRNFEVVKDDRFKTIEDLEKFFDRVESIRPKTKPQDWYTDRYEKIIKGGKVYTCLVRSYRSREASLYYRHNHPDDAVWRYGVERVEILNGIPGERNANKE